MEYCNITMKVLYVLISSAKRGGACDSHCGEGGNSATPKMMDLAENLCLVTGGTAGIGSATALEFARRGANVAITDLHQNSEVARELIAVVENIGM